MWQLMLEGGHDSSPSNSHEVLTFSHDLRWDDVVMVQGWHFNLNSLNTEAADEPNLSISLSLEGRLAQFQPDNPVNLRFKFRVLRVKNNILE